MDFSDCKLIARVNFLDYSGSDTIISPPNLSFVRAGSSLVGKEFEMPTFVNYVGLVAMSELSKSPVFIWKAPLDATLKSLNIENHIAIPGKFMTHFNGLIANLWFIRDNSCYCPTAYTVFEETGGIIVSPNNVFISNSLGEYSDVTFDYNDILKAFEIQQKLGSLFGPKLMSTSFQQTQQNYSAHGTQPSYLNYANYDFNRIERAFYMLLNARKNSLLPLKISFYIATFECLFGTGDTELRHRLTQRVVFYLGGPKEVKLENAANFKKGYDVRSSFLHGDTMKKNLQTREQLQAVSIQLDELLRQCFLKVIASDSENFLELDRGKFANWLDDMVYDAKN